MLDLRPGERLDHLILDGMRILQREDEFRFSIDAILLAHFASVKRQARVADLGAGTGVIALLAAWRDASRVDAYEINPLMADLAARSVALNNLAARVFVREADYRRIREVAEAGTCDLVVSNPPYRAVGQGDISALEGVAAARHELTATLGDVIRAAKYLLKFRGRFAMVHLPERLPEIMAEMQRADIEPKRMRLVQSTADKPPSMVLIEGILGGKPALSVERPLVIYDARGAYSSEILGYYGR